MTNEEFVEHMRCYTDGKHMFTLNVSEFLPKVTRLCDIIDGMIPALDLLQKHLEDGNTIEYQDGRWWIFDGNGDGVTCGKTLRAILVNLIFTDC